MRRLPLDRHGRPVPWFVHTDPATGEVDFRVVGEGKQRDAHRFDLCWICGTPRGRHAAFVVGPMCAVNRVSAEPPSHLECATYSAQACPFLSTPSMTRRRRGLGDLDEATAGVALDRNPGVALVWSSRSWMPFSVPAELGKRAAGTLWDLGEPTAVSWYAHGRAATRAEVQASMDSGVPHLRAMCQLDRDPVESLALLEREIERAAVLLPPAPTP
jgi:hypothetical protein